MSWDVIHEIFGLAATDEAFAQELLTSPVEAIEQRGYSLAPEERNAFQGSTADTLSLLSQDVLRQLSSSFSKE